MMTEWYQKAIDALQLNGPRERTQEAYVQSAGQAKGAKLGQARYMPHSPSLPAL